MRSDHLKHYRILALEELRKVLTGPQGPQDVAVDAAIRKAKGLPPRPAGAEPYARLFPHPPQALPLAALEALVGKGKAQKWQPALDEALCDAHITDRDEVAQFLAQVLEESGGLQYTHELWGPTPAQEKYDTRTDLGNTPAKDGDGYLYSGRGLIMLTGRANYRKAGDELGLPLERHPELAAQPINAARIAVWYWQSHHLGMLSRQGGLEAVTRAVNGGTNGLEARRKWLTKARGALEDAR